MCHLCTPLADHPTFTPEMKEMNRNFREIESVAAEGVLRDIRREHQPFFEHDYGEKEVRYFLMADGRCAIAIERYNTDIFPDVSVTFVDESVCTFLREHLDVACVEI